MTFVGGDKDFDVKELCYVVPLNPLTGRLPARQTKCSHHFWTYQEFYCFKSIFWFKGVAEKNISRFFPWEGGDFCPQSLDFLEEMNKKLYKLGTMGN